MTAWRDRDNDRRGVRRGAGAFFPSYSLPLFSPPSPTDGFPGKVKTLSGGFWRNVVVVRHSLTQVFGEAMKAEVR